MSVAQSEPLKEPQFRKRTHADSEHVGQDEFEGELVSENAILGLEDNAQILLDAPASKKAKLGRKPLPDAPCEHGPSIKSCQKCIYRNRVEKAVVRYDHRGALMKVLLLWSQNLVYFGSLSSSLALPNKNPNGMKKVVEIVEARLEHFRQYEAIESKKYKDLRADVVNDTVLNSFEMISLASPASVETVFIAKWLLGRTYKGNEEFSMIIGFPSYQFTERIAMLWEDNMICPGINDPEFLEHFRLWKGNVWKNAEGVYAVRQPRDECIRSVHCTGFTSEGMCDRCATVKSLLAKEKNSFKNSPPGFQALLSMLPTAHKEILKKSKLGNFEENEYVAASVEEFQFEENSNLENLNE